MSKVKRSLGSSQKVIPSRLESILLDKDIHIRIDKTTWELLKLRARNISRIRNTRISPSDMARAIIIAYIGDPLGEIMLYGDLDMRNKLPNRRDVVTVKIEHRNIQFHISFGFGSDTKIREAFCAEAKEGTDFHALITDGCILISLHLQTGATLKGLAKSLGEDRLEGNLTGPPSSVLGAIVRAGIELEKSMEADAR
jgi:hypothetical protein